MRDGRNQNFKEVSPKRTLAAFFASRAALAAAFFSSFVNLRSKSSSSPAPQAAARVSAAARASVSTLPYIESNSLFTLNISALVRFSFHFDILPIKKA
jgi:hypothetical protein